MKYKIADLIVEFNAKFDRTNERAQKYICEENRKKDISITVNDEAIKKKKESYKLITDELVEYLIIGSTFYKGLLNYNGCLLHASAVVIDDESYLFSANSGTGKSTHTSLWLKYLSEKNPYILNDDKPAIRIMEDGIYAYGTPFSGKHDINKNTRAKIKGICFLEQATKNSIKRIEPKEAVFLFFEQTTKKLTKEQMLKLLDIMDIILKEIPIYKLCCDMSEEAVKLSYNTMRGEDNHEN